MVTRSLKSNICIHVGLQQKDKTENTRYGFSILIYLYHQIKKTKNKNIPDKDKKKVFQSLTVNFGGQMPFSVMILLKLQ